MTITVDEIEEAANSVDLEDIEDFTMNAPEYCRYLLSEIDRLEKERSLLYVLADKASDVLDAIAPDLEKLAKAHNAWLDYLRTLKDEDKK